MSHSSHRVVFSNWARDDRQTIDRACGRLGTYPEVGRLRDDVRPGVRSIPSGQHIVYNVIEHRHVRIIRILHARQDPLATAGF